MEIHGPWVGRLVYLPSSTGSNWEVSLFKYTPTYGVGLCGKFVPCLSQNLASCHVSCRTDNTVPCNKLHVVTVDLQLFFAAVQAPHVSEKVSPSCLDKSLSADQTRIPSNDTSQHLHTMKSGEIWTHTQPPGPASMVPSSPTCALSGRSASAPSTALELLASEEFHRALQMDLLANLRPKAESRRSSAYIGIKRSTRWCSDKHVSGLI